MYEQLVYGINEIVCESNKDRYKIIKKIVEDRKSLFIDYFKEINSVEKLELFINKKMGQLIRNYSIECIVIQSLDSFLFTAENLPKKQKIISKIIRKLKNFVKLYKIKVLITTTLFKRSVVDEIIVNIYLGFQWCYQRNSIFIMQRNFNGEIEILNQVERKILTKFKLF